MPLDFELNSHYPGAAPELDHLLLKALQLWFLSFDVCYAFIVTMNILKHKNSQTLQMFCYLIFIKNLQVFIFVPHKEIMFLASTRKHNTFLRYFFSRYSYNNKYYCVRELVQKKNKEKTFYRAILERKFMYNGK